MSVFTEKLATRLRESGCEPTPCDLQFLEKCAAVIPRNAHNSLISTYVENWVRVLESVNRDHRAQKKGRFAANSFVLSRMKEKGLSIA